MTDGLTRDEAHRYYWNGDGPIPSVTTVAKVLDKSNVLVGWAKRETAACAVRNLPMLNQMVETGGPKAAIDWLKAIPDYQRDAAADLGTRVHALAEQVVKDQPVDMTDEEHGFVNAYYRDFIAVFRPKFVAVEALVCSLKHNYAGTLDSIAEIDGERWLLDIKTGSGVYAETALQLAAYNFADFIGRPGDPKRYRLPRATRFGVIHVRPERARLVEFAVTEDTFAAFLAARRLYDWQQGPAKSVVGAAVEGVAA